VNEPELFQFDCEPGCQCAGGHVLDDDEITIRVAHRHRGKKHIARVSLFDLLARAHTSRPERLQQILARLNAHP
jgi:hypothetical protein